MEPFKGLGELHPGQLLKITSDPQARVLLRVRVNDVQDAEMAVPHLTGPHRVVRGEC